MASPYFALMIAVTVSMFPVPSGTLEFTVTLADHCKLLLVPNAEQMTAELMNKTTSAKSTTLETCALVCHLIPGCQYFSFDTKEMTCLKYKTGHRGKPQKTPFPLYYYECDESQRSNASTIPPTIVQPQFTHSIDASSAGQSNRTGWTKASANATSVYPGGTGVSIPPGTRTPYPPRTGTKSSGSTTMHRDDKSTISADGDGHGTGSTKGTHTQKPVHTVTSKESTGSYGTRFTENVTGPVVTGVTKFPDKNQTSIAGYTAGATVSSSTDETYTGPTESESNVTLSQRPFTQSPVPGVSITLAPTANRTSGSVAPGTNANATGTGTYATLIPPFSVPPRLTMSTSENPSFTGFTKSSVTVPQKNFTDTVIDFTPITDGPISMRYCLVCNFTYRTINSTSPFPFEYIYELDKSGIETTINVSKITEQLMTEALLTTASSLYRTSISNANLASRETEKMDNLNYSTSLKPPAKTDNNTEILTTKTDRVTATPVSAKEMRTTIIKLNTKTTLSGNKSGEITKKPHQSNATPTTSTTFLETTTAKPNETKCITKAQKNRWRRDVAMPLAVKLKTFHSRSFEECKFAAYYFNPNNGIYQRIAFTYVSHVSGRIPANIDCYAIYSPMVSDSDFYDYLRTYTIFTSARYGVDLVCGIDQTKYRNLMKKN